VITLVEAGSFGADEVTRQGIATAQGRDFDALQRTNDMVSLGFTGVAERKKPVAGITHLLVIPAQQCDRAATAAD
jgi:hypothetical protein